MYNCYIAIHISAFCIFYICHFSTRIKTELKLNWHSLRLSFCKTPKISFWMTNFKYLHFYIILHYYSNITLATTLFMRLHCFCNSTKIKCKKFQLLYCRLNVFAIFSPHYIPYFIHYIPNIYFHYIIYFLLQIQIWITI